MSNQDVFHFVFILNILSATLSSLALALAIALAMAMAAALDSQSWFTVLIVDGGKSDLPV